MTFARGASHHNAKLTDADILDIRRRVLEGGYGIQTALAWEYGVVCSTIADIVNGSNWRHVPHDATAPACQMTLGQARRQALDMAARMLEEGIVSLGQPLDLSAEEWAKVLAELRRVARWLARRDRQLRED